MKYAITLFLCAMSMLWIWYYEEEKALNVELKHSSEMLEVLQARRNDFVENNRKLEILREGVNQAITECQEPKTNWIRIGQ